MNRIVLSAQLMGALVMTVAAAAVLNPQGVLEKKVVEEPPLSQFVLKIGDSEIPLHSLKPASGPLTRTSKIAKNSKLRFWMVPEWTPNAVRLMDAALRGGGAKLQAAIMAGDARLEFKNGLITEIQFPAGDGAAKEPAFMALKMDTEVTDYQGGAAASPTRLSRGARPPVPPPSSSSKVWLPANFRLEIAGLDCSHVSKVGAFAGVRAGGSGRRVWGDPHICEVVMPKADFLKAGWIAKWEGPDFDATKSKFVPRQASLAYLEAGGGPLAALNFRVEHLGKVTGLPGNQIKIEMYCELLSLK